MDPKSLEIAQRKSVIVSELERCKTNAELKRTARMLFWQNTISMSEIADCIYNFVNRRCDAEIRTFFRNLKLCIEKADKDQAQQILKRAFRRNNPTFAPPLANPGGKLSRRRTRKFEAR